MSQSSEGKATVSRGQPSNFSICLSTVNHQTASGTRSPKNNQSSRFLVLLDRTLIPMPLILLYKEACHVRTEKADVPTAPPSDPLTIKASRPSVLLLFHDAGNRQSESGVKSRKDGRNKFKSTCFFTFLIRQVIKIPKMLKKRRNLKTILT